MKSPTVKVGPGVFRRRGALPRPPDRTQVLPYAGDLVDELDASVSLVEQVRAVFRAARRRR